MDNKHALTVLNRLAAREPGQERRLAQAFQSRLDSLAELAMDIAIETGDPIGRILAREVDNRRSVELAALLMKRCEADHYCISIPLRELCLVVTKRVLAGAATDPALLEPVFQKMAPQELSLTETPSPTQP